MIASLPAGYSAPPPTPDDLREIADIVAAAQLADLGRSDATPDPAADDQQGLDLATMAVLVRQPNGAAAACADVLVRAHAVVSVYGHVHPVHRGRGLGRWLVGRGEEYTRHGMAFADPASPVVAQHYVPVENAGAITLFARLGYGPFAGCLKWRSASGTRRPRR